jgi:hypothetical protein
MLEHTVKDLIESAVITHRRTGAMATLTVTMESADPWTDFNVRLAYDSPFSVSGEGVWRYLQVRGDWLRYAVSYVQEARHAGRPSFRIDAPRNTFGIQFFVEVPLSKVVQEREPEHA